MVKGKHGMVAVKKVLAPDVQQLKDGCKKRQRDKQQVRQFVQEAFEVV